MTSRYRSEEEPSRGGGGYSNSASAFGGHGRNGDSGHNRDQSPQRRSPPTTRRANGGFSSGRGGGAGRYYDDRGRDQKRDDDRDTRGNFGNDVRDDRPERGRDDDRGQIGKTYEERGGQRGGFDGDRGRGGGYHGEGRGDRDRDGREDGGKDSGRGGGFGRDQWGGRGGRNDARAEGGRGDRNDGNGRGGRSDDRTEGRRGDREGFGADRGAGRGRYYEGGKNDRDGGFTEYRASPRGGGGGGREEGRDGRESYGGKKGDEEEGRKGDFEDRGKGTYDNGDGRRDEGRGGRGVFGVKRDEANDGGRKGGERGVHFDDDKGDRGGGYGGNRGGNWGGRDEGRGGSGFNDRGRGDGGFTEYRGRGGGAGDREGRGGDRDGGFPPRGNRSEFGRGDRNDNFDGRKGDRFDDDRGRDRERDGYSGGRGNYSGGYDDRDESRGGRFGAERGKERDPFARDGRAVDPDGFGKESNGFRSHGREEGRARHGADITEIDSDRSDESGDEYGRDGKGKRDGFGKREEKGSFGRDGGGGFDDGSGGWGQESGGFSSGRGGFADRKEFRRDLNELNSQGERKFASSGYVTSSRTVDELFESDARNAENQLLDVDEKLQITGKDADVIHEIQSWQDSGLDQNLIDLCVHRCQYKVVRPIQAIGIPAIMAGRDILAQSETGSGKSAAFMLPLVHEILNANRTLTGGQVEAILVAPTRELVMQLHEQALRFTKTMDTIRVIYSYGQVGYVSTINELSTKGAHILITTVGRLEDHIKSQHIVLDALRFFVLDEADRMLDDDKGVWKMDAIFNHPKWPKGKIQSILCSATMKKEVKDYAAKVLKPDYLTISPASEVGANKKITQNFHKTEGLVDKNSLLFQMLQEESEGDSPFRKTLIFVNKIESTNVLALFFSAKLQGVKAQSLHSDKGQDLRDDAIGQFRSGEVQVLIGTDVCERGLDIEGLEHVINFDMPTVAERYTHRIGRTGRVRNGTATSFITEQDSKILPGIVQIVKASGQVVPEWMEEMAKKAEEGGGFGPSSGFGGGGAGYSSGFGSGFGDSGGFGSGGNSGGFGKSEGFGSGGFGDGGTGFGSGGFGDSKGGFGSGFDSTTSGGGFGAGNGFSNNDAGGFGAASDTGFGSSSGFEAQSAENQETVEKKIEVAVCPEENEEGDKKANSEDDCADSMKENGNDVVVVEEEVDVVLTGTESPDSSDSSNTKTTTEKEKETDSSTPSEDSVNPLPSDEFEVKDNGEDSDEESRKEMEEEERLPRRRRQRSESDHEEEENGEKKEGSEYSTADEEEKLIGDDTTETSDESGEKAVKKKEDVEEEKEEKEHEKRSGAASADIEEKDATRVEDKEVNVSKASTSDSMQPHATSNNAIPDDDW